MNPNFRNFALWVIILVLVLALFAIFQNPGQRSATQEISYSGLLAEVEAGRVADVTVAGPEITGHFVGRGNYGHWK